MHKLCIVSVSIIEKLRNFVNPGNFDSSSPAGLASLRFTIRPLSFGIYKNVALVLFAGCNITFYHCCSICIPYFIQDWLLFNPILVAVVFIRTMAGMVRYGSPAHCPPNSNKYGRIVSTYGKPILIFC